MKHAMQIEQVHWQLMPVGLRCTLPCVQEATCGSSGTTCTGSCLRTDVCVVFPGEGDEGLSYYAVAVARRNNPSVNFYTLKDKVACFPGEVSSVFCFFLVFFS